MKYFRVDTDLLSGFLTVEYISFYCHTHTDTRHWEHSALLHKPPLETGCYVITHIDPMSKHTTNLEIRI